LFVSVSALLQDLNSPSTTLLLAPPPTPLPPPPQDHFIGFGLDSTEQGNPASKFAKAFARARELGFHVVAHAGEEGPASYMNDVLEVLKVRGGGGGSVRGRGVVKV